MKSIPAYYYFYQTSQPKGSNNHPKLHACAVPADTVVLDELQLQPLKAALSQTK